MTIEEYARAIAEAVLHVCEQCGLDDLDADDVRESLSDIIASVPAPDVQALRGQIESEVWEARKRVEAALSAEIVELRAQIDAARADEREGWLELLERLEVYAAQYNEGGIRKHNRSPRLARGPLFDAMKRICAEIRARSGARGV